MKISAYNISLSLLKESETELVRLWRNDERIQSFMIKKVEISREMQTAWFQRVDNEHNYFFLIQSGDKNAGLINISGINFEEGTAYTGLFIADPAFIGSSVSVSASLTLLDFFFTVFPLTKLFAQVRSDNQNAIGYNRSLGFEITEKREDHMLLSLSRNDYFKGAEALRKAAAGLYGDTILCSMEAEDLDKRPLLAKLIRKYASEKSEDRKIIFAGS